MANNNDEREAQKHDLLSEVRWRADNLGWYKTNRDQFVDILEKLPPMIDPEFSRLERLTYAAHVQFYQALVDLGEYSQRRLETLSKYSGVEKK